MTLDSGQLEILKDKKECKNEEIWMKKSQNFKIKSVLELFS